MCSALSHFVASCWIAVVWSLFSLQCPCFLHSDSCCILLFHHVHFHFQKMQILAVLGRCAKSNRAKPSRHMCFDNPKGCRPSSAFQTGILQRGTLIKGWLLQFYTFKCSQVFGSNCACEEKWYYTFCGSRGSCSLKDDLNPCCRDRYHIFLFHTGFFIDKTRCLHDPQCNLSTELHHWRPFISFNGLWNCLWGCMYRTTV